MAREKRTFASIKPNASRDAGRSATPDPTACATTPRTPSPPASTPRRSSRPSAARSTAAGGTPTTTTRPSRSRSAPTPRGGWPTGTSPAGRSRPAPASTTSRSSMTTCSPRSATGRWPRSSRRTCAQWYEATLTDRPTMRSHAYSLLRTIMASAVNDEIIDANPCRIVGAGRAKRVHKIRPASIEELAVLTAEMPEKLRLMVTLASLVCAAVRRNRRATPRRHRPRPRGDPGASRSDPRGRHVRDHHTQE